MGNSKKEIIIIGGGGHTRVVIGLLQASGANVKGILTRKESLIGKDILGVPVLGSDEDITLDPATTRIVNAVGNRVTSAGPGLEARIGVYLRYKAHGFSFLDLVHKQAILMPHVTLGEGVQLMPGAVLQTGVTVGENTIINTSASIDHDAVIYPHCHIAPGAIICGDAVVGEGTHIGAGAVIIQGVRVGCNVVIGAGAVVNRNVPDNAVVRPPASEQTRLTAGKVV